MDHILLPSDDLAHPPFEVEFLSTARFRFDGGEFISFPDRVGIDVALLAKDSFLGLKLKDSAPFLQAWLWFALLGEYLGVASLEMQDTNVSLFDIFVKTIGDRKYLSLKSFHKVAAQARAARDSSSDHQEPHERLGLCLRAVGDFLRSVVETPFITCLSKSDALSSGPHEVFLILIAIHVLCQEIENDYQASMPTALPVTLFPVADFPCTILDSLLIQAGWCPQAIQGLPRDANLRYYLSFCRATPSDGLDHPSRDGCHCESVKVGKLVPRHTHESCRCGYVEARSADVHDTSLQNNAVIFRLRKTRLGTRVLEGETIDLSAERPSRRYVAISHVRRAGLGNADSRSLPFCQVSLIQILANQLVSGNGEETPFWIDTLCLPLDRAARKRAERRIRRVFEGASHVLVLDPPLSRHTFASPQEALIRIRYSAWIGRLWTLEEALYSGQLVFRFSNALVSLDQLLRQFDGVSVKEPSETRLAIKKRGIWLSPKEEVLLPKLLSGFSDDIHTLSRHATREEALEHYRCDEVELCRTLRYGYLLAKKFQYFVKDDEVELIKRGWVHLVKTYSGVAELETPDHNEDLGLVVARLRAMSTLFSGLVLT